MLRRVHDISMRYKLIAIIVSPALAQDFTYKDYAKASEVWRRGFVFGISQYMSAVAQPDEEPPYPVRTALKTIPRGLDG